VTRTVPRLTALAATAAITALAGTAATAPAVVPPRDCGNMSVSGKRYQIKVDQISCKDGKGYAKKYIQSRSKPRGYSCKRYPARKNRVTFYCNNGRRVFFAIRR
jgi:hypothetical protein